jgi:thiamine biosynthesis lipoprotein
MRRTRDDIMGMPITVEIVGGTAVDIEAVFDHFRAVDARFSTYRPASEISRLNRGELREKAWSDDLREIFALAEQTKHDTDGYFSIERPDGSIDPSGIVKGWAIQRAAELVRRRGSENYFIDAGGDIQSHGFDNAGRDWTIGIRNPFNRAEIVKVLYPRGRGVATSGTAVRGQHIYDPYRPGRTIDDVVSLTVIGPDIYEADRFATAAFAMGRNGIAFVENLPGFEGYLIDADGMATLTSGLNTLAA